MKIMFDTSVLVAAIVEPHPMHQRSWHWLNKAKSKKFEMLVASHTLAELYAVLTTLPLRPRITPDMSRYLIKQNIETIARIIPLSPSDYLSTIRQMSELGISGGAVYDALITKAAVKAEADRLLTFNIPDFVKVWPEGESRIQEP